MPRILVVDDSWLTRRVVRGSLMKAGLQHGQFVEDVDGLDAPAQIDEFGSFDLVFCDLCMPNMDGVEFLDALAERETFDRCPVVDRHRRRRPRKGVRNFGSGRQKTDSQAVFSGVVEGNAD